MNTKNFKPTRLYVKELNGLFYFGKTVRQDIYSYTGSGKRWLNHVRKYGKSQIKTVWVSDWFKCPTHLEDFAEMFSRYNDIVNSAKWANLIPENGINGGGDARQLRDPGLREKARQTKLRKYGHNGNPSAHKPTWFNSDICVNRRNETNLLRHGNKCAANKNGNKESKLAQTILLTRELVTEIKILAELKGKRQPRGWWYHSDELLCQKKQELLSLPTKKSHVPESNRLQVRIVRAICTLTKTVLPKNWFLSTDSAIEGYFIQLSTSYPRELDIVLRTFHLTDLG